MVHTKLLLAFLFQATSKPNVANLRDQMSLACTHITDHSPVWGMLQEMQFYWDLLCSSPFIFLLLTILVLNSRCQYCFIVSCVKTVSCHLLFSLKKTFSFKIVRKLLRTKYRHSQRKNVHLLFPSICAGKVRIQNSIENIAIVALTLLFIITNVSCYREGK